MSARRSRRVWKLSHAGSMAVWACGALLLAGGSTSAVSAAEKVRFATIEQAVRAEAAELELEPNELMVRGEAQQLLKAARATGWEVPHEQRILARTYRESDMLAKHLRTRKGKTLARDVAKIPGGYDQLDRLTRISGGEKILKGLVRGPDGYKMIDYIETAPGGKNLGKMLTHTPGGKDVTKPTRKIYTVDELVAHLKKLHQQTQRRKTAARRSR